MNARNLTVEFDNDSNKLTKVIDARIPNWGENCSYVDNL